jgi:hypothetical protein
MGYQHALVLSSLVNARLYRQCHTAAGVPFRIQRQVMHSAQACFAGLEHYLSIAYLNGSERQKIAA